MSDHCQVPKESGSKLNVRNCSQKLGKVISQNDHASKNSSITLVASGGGIVQSSNNTVSHNSTIVCMTGVSREARQAILNQKSRHPRCVNRCTDK